MPLYEFQCTECELGFEELVRTATAIDEVECPMCGSRHVRRKVSTFASKGSASGGNAYAAASACAPTGG